MCLQMTLRERQWRKHQRELDQLLCYSDSDDEQEGIKKNCNTVPGTPDSLMCDSDLRTSDDFDFDTDVNYSNDSEQEPNKAAVTSFEDELRQWA